jgi:hypothetical protein
MRLAQVGLKNALGPVGLGGRPEQLSGAVLERHSVCPMSSGSPSLGRFARKPPGPAVATVQLGGFFRAEVEPKAAPGRPALTGV